MDVCFDKLFWIFFVACILGVLIEGMFCLITQGRWETHVLTVWGWFNFVYGFGAVGFYIMAAKFNMPSLVLKVFIMTLIATLLELFFGMVVKYGFGMMAWDYSDQWLNVQGLICPLFSLAWAIPAFLMCIGYKKLSRLLDPLCKPQIHVIAVILCVLLMIDFVAAMLCVYRWSGRHYGVEAKTQLGYLIDRLAPDDWMSKRFVEWKFIE